MLALGTQALFQLSRRRPGAREAHAAQGPRARAAGRLRHRHALHARATTRGTSACASCPTATCSRPSASGAASVVTDHIDTFTETRPPARVGRRARGRRHRHRHRARAAVPRRHRRCPSTARRSTCPSRLTYKGMMLEGVPEPGARLRLHERVVDAEGRPHLRLRLPAAQPPARPRLRQCTPLQPRRGRSPPGRCSACRRATSSARSTGCPKQGSPVPVAGAPELPARLPGHEARPASSTTASC